MRLEKGRRELTYLLDEDPELTRDLAPRDAELARRAVIARVINVPEGPWHPGDEGDGDTRLGVLVLSGLMTRDVLLAGIGCTELLGKGDLLHPWLMAEGEPSVPMEIGWRALEPTRLAVLDERFVAVVAPWPPITARILERAVARAQTLAVHFAITCMLGLELRLYVLFWHLADRFGHVAADGVVVPLRLTHDTLARLVAARRPSVTTALKRLGEQELVTAREDGSWLVSGDPPQEIHRMQAAWRRHHSTRATGDAEPRA